MKRGANGPRFKIKTPGWILKGGTKPIKKDGIRKKRLGKTKKAGRRSIKKREDFRNSIFDPLRTLPEEVTGIPNY